MAPTPTATPAASPAPTSPILLAVIKPHTKTETTDLEYTGYWHCFNKKVRHKADIGEIYQLDGNNGQ